MASGGVLGLATVLLTRGPEIQLGTGDSIEMILESNVDLNPAKEAIARDAGARHFLQPSREMDAEALAAVLREAFDPIDVLIECSGARVAAAG